MQARRVACAAALVLRLLRRRSREPVREAGAAPGAGEAAVGWEAALGTAPACLLQHSSGLGGPSCLRETEPLPHPPRSSEASTEPGCEPPSPLPGASSQAPPLPRPCRSRGWRLPPSGCPALLLRGAAVPGVQRGPRRRRTWKATPRVRLGLTRSDPGESLPWWPATSPSRHLATAVLPTGCLADSADCLPGHAAAPFGHVTPPRRPRLPRAEDRPFA